MNTSGEIYIWTHQGLGDAIICNGLIRNIRKKLSNKLIFFCKPQFFESISFMFRDLLNFEIVPKHGEEVNSFLSGVSKEQQIHIGHHFITQFLEQKISFDEAFYKQIGLKFERSWTDFLFERNLINEKNLIKKLNISDKYVFLHEDRSRNLLIDRSYIQNKEITVFEPDFNFTNNIFDYISILENASEIHCIDSCFKQLADRFANQDTKLFLHHNLMGNRIKDITRSQSKLNWTII